MSGARDPRRDPRPGDVLIVKGHTITVLRWPGRRGDVWKTAVRWRDEATQLPFTSAHIAAWRRMTKGTTVVRRGK